MGALAGEAPNHSNEALRVRRRQGKDLREIGEIVGLSSERVRLIQVEAMQSLRQIMEAEGLSAEVLFTD